MGEWKEEYLLGRMGGRIIAWMNGWKNAWMDRQKFDCQIESCVIYD